MSANDSTQKNKTRAPAILASKQNGGQAISTTESAVDVVSAGVKSVKWSDMSDGSLTDFRTYTLNLTELQQKITCARNIRKQRDRYTQVGPETLVRDPTPCVRNAADKAKKSNLIQHLSTSENDPKQEFES